MGKVYEIKPLAWIPSGESWEAFGFEKYTVKTVSGTVILEVRLDGAFLHETRCESIEAAKNAAEARYASWLLPRLTEADELRSALAGLIDAVIEQAAAIETPRSGTSDLVFDELTDIREALHQSARKAREVLDRYGKGGV